MNADDFNRGAESYYRGNLRRRHKEEGLGFLRQDFREFDRLASRGDAAVRGTLDALGVKWGAEAHLDAVGADLLADRLEGEGLRRLINLTLLSISQDDERAMLEPKRGEDDADHAAPVYRAR